MSEDTVKARSRPLPSVAELQSVYETRAVSEARADLSRIVEEVSLLGSPMILSKHDRARVAIVPLSVLAQARSNFLAAAKRLAETPSATREDHKDDIDFEDLPGLNLADVRDTWTQATKEARAEDAAAVQVATERRVLLRRTVTEEERDETSATEEAAKLAKA